MEKLDLSVIMLTGNEEIHIRRALDNVCPIAQQVFVIDCFSTDRTVEICNEFDNVTVVKHAWPGNQAEQFNWALDNVDIKTSWIFRLDADEYLTDGLKAEMLQKLPSMPDDVSAVVLPLGRAFHGRLLKHGIVKGIKMIRLFRNGRVRYEQRLMDEHLQVLTGKTAEFENQFVDDNLISMAAFTTKHNGYSNREAALLLDAEYGLSEASNDADSQYAEEVAAKRKQKAKYAKMPLYWRSIGYFLYRYFVKLGFMDGRAGFEWDFFQGLWYRMLIDSKVAEAKRLCGDDKDKMRRYVNDILGVKLAMKTALTTVTVVIPVYNVAPFVERCLLSVMQQTFPAAECVIVDDCSTDDSIARCKQLIHDYKGTTRFSILYHEYNRGLSAARNTGTKAATGEYIYYLDSDDEITSDCLERLVEPLRRNDSLDMIMGEYQTDLSAMTRLGGASLSIISHYSHYHKAVLESNEEVRKWYFSRIAKPDQGWNKLLRLSFVKDNQLYFKEGLLYEDLLWSFYLYRHLNQVALVPDVTYIHHRRPGSIMTKTGREEYLKHHGYTFKEIATQIKQNKNIEDTLRWLPDFCHCYIDAADNTDYKYAYQVFKNQLSDGQHRIASFELELVNFMSKNPIGRMLYKSNAWVCIQIQRIVSLF